MLLRAPITAAFGLGAACVSAFSHAATWLCATTRATEHEQVVVVPSFDADALYESGALHGRVVYEVDEGRLLATRPKHDGGALSVDRTACSVHNRRWSSELLRKMDAFRGCTWVVPDADAIGERDIVREILMTPAFRCMPGSHVVFFTTDVDTVHIVRRHFDSVHVHAIDAHTMGVVATV
jgi:hypothetical protein